MTSAWTRLVVTFKDDLEVTVAEIQECVRQAYDVGYTGLFVSDNHKCVYMQTLSLNARMSPNKVSRICSRFGNIRSVKTFSRLEGICMEEIGEYRKAGRRWVKASHPTEEMQPPAKNHTVGTCTPALPKKRNHTATGQPEFSEEEDPVFIPVYTGFDGDWKIVSWNRATKKAKRQACTKFREHVLELQEHKCNYCRCNVSFGEYSNADMDHIVPLNAGGEQDLSNVHVLCTPCHRRKTAMECRRLTTTLSGVMSVAFRPSERQSAGAESAE